MNPGDPVRLNGRTGRIADILTSQNGGGDYAKIRFVVHAKGVYEFHPVLALTRATDADIAREIKARISKLNIAHDELLGQVARV